MTQIDNTMASRFYYTAKENLRHNWPFCFSVLHWINKTIRNSRRIVANAVLVILDKIFPIIANSRYAELAGRVISELECSLSYHSRRVCFLYSRHLAARMHTLNWKTMLGNATGLSPLLKPIIEHANFHYEAYVIRLRQGLAGQKVEEDIFPSHTIQDYVRRFFSNPRVVDLLSRDLEQAGIKEERTPSGIAPPASILNPPAPISTSSGEERTDVETDVSAFYSYWHLMHMAYHAGRGYLVGPLTAPMRRTQKRLLRNLPKPSKELKASLKDMGIDDLEQVRMHSPDWTSNIGHIGHLNVHLKMRELGWYTEKPLLITYPERIANRAFLDLLRNRCPTFIVGENLSAPLWHELASLIPFLSQSLHSYAIPSGEAMYWNDAGARALAQWDAENRGYPMRDAYDQVALHDDAINTHYSALRREHGMTEQDWYVCLHMRDGGARGETDGIGESIRNTSMQTYMDAVRFITAAGGWVIRMGGPKTQPFPKMDRVIDYAHYRDQTPQMDIHLVRNARMFIGTTSGFAYVASAFGIPSAMVNSISSIGLLWSKNTRFTLKPVYTADGRMLSLKEFTSDAYRWSYPTHESMERGKLTVRDNASDEITEATKEVLDLCTGQARDDDFDDTWRNHLGTPHFFGSSRPSKYFLEKHPTLLSDWQKNTK